MHCYIFLFFSFSLDLDAWINEPIEESDSDSEMEATEDLFIKSERSESIKSERYKPEPSEEELSKVNKISHLIQNKFYLIRF